jgi:hypothetical protein
MDPNVMMVIMGSVIAALLALVGNMYRVSRNHRNQQGGNPGCQAVEVWEKHHRYQDLMTEKMDKLIGGIAHLTTIIEERLPRGGG